MDDTLECTLILIGLTGMVVFPVFMVVCLVKLSTLSKRFQSVENTVFSIEGMLRSVTHTQAQLLAAQRKLPPSNIQAHPVHSTTPEPAHIPSRPEQPPRPQQPAQPQQPEQFAQQPEQPIASPTPPQATAAVPASKPQPSPELPTPEIKETATPTAPSQQKTPPPTDPPTPKPPAAKPTKPQTSRPKSGALERGIGGTLAVWAGAGALALAGALLVQYSIEQDLISPEFRVALGVGAGILLLVIGEWLTRKIRLVGGGLLAAGIAVLYSAFLASTMLYTILPAFVGTLLMFLTTATAAALAIRHKMIIIAVLGLLGGFLTPVVIGTNTDNPILFFGYLLLLNAGVITVAWKCKWPLLTYMALILSFIAEIGWMSNGTQDLTAPYMIMIALMTGPFALASAFNIGIDTPDTTKDTANKPNSWSWVLMSASLMMPIFVGLIAGVRWTHTPYLWVQQSLLAVLALVVSGLNPRYRPLPMCAWLLLAAQQCAYLFEEPTGGHFMTIATCICLIFGLGFATLTVRRPDRIAEPLSMFIILGLQLTLLYAYPPTRTMIDHWGVVMLVFAAGFLALIWIVLLWSRRQANDEDKDNATAKRPRSIPVLAVGAATFLSLAIPFELESQWLTVAWSFEAISLLFIGLRFKETSLVIFSSLVAIAAALCLLPIPPVLDDLKGGYPVFNTILYLYGVTAVSAFVASGLFGRYSKTATLGTVIYGLAGLVLVLIGVTLNVRHFFHPELSGPFTRPEHLAYSISWASIGVLTLLVGLVRRSAIARVVSLALIVGTSLKVFLFDLSHLTGLGRVASVAALGVILIVIAILYRVYVFPQEDNAAPDDNTDIEPSPETTEPVAVDHEESAPSPEPAPPSKPNNTEQTPENTATAPDETPEDTAEATPDTTPKPSEDDDASGHDEPTS